MTAPPDQPYGVVIRSREVWDKLCSVEAAVQVIRSELTPTVKDHGKQLEDLSQRVRSLEEARWRAVGAGAVLGTLGAVAIQFLTR
jgi:hypothetical protein